MKKHRFVRDKKIGIVVIISAMIFFVIFSFYDFNTSVERRELEKEMEVLDITAKETAAIVENKLQGYLNVLHSVARALQNNEIHGEAALNYVRDVVSKEGIEFQRIGVSDLEGNSIVSNGSQLNIAQRDYFLEAKEGKSYISGKIESKILDKEVFMVSVPIYANDQTIKGVVYGTVEMEDFELFSDTSMFDETQYIHVVDREGNYILKTELDQEEKTENSLFERLETIGESQQIDKVKEAFEKGESLTITLREEGNERYMYFNPIQINDWYIVTVMETEKMYEHVNALKSSVLYLSMKLLMATLAVGGAYLYHAKKEKDKVNRLNDELRLKDETFQLAVASTNDRVFTYDVKEDTLKFMNGTIKELSLAKTIPYARETLRKRLENNPVVKQKVGQLFDSIRRGEESAECEISMTNEMHGVCYHIYLQNLFNHEHKIVRSVGIIEDITEEKRKELQLQKEVRLRETLLSDTVGFIEADLMEDRLIRYTAPMLTSWELQSYSQALEILKEKYLAFDESEEAWNQMQHTTLLHHYEQGMTDIVVELLCKEENEYWLECELHMEKDAQSGHIIVFEIFRNIDEKKKKELDLKKQAATDMLTGAWNRTAGVEQIDAILAESTANSKHAFVILDLDNFKTLNDTHGHIMGDKALIDVVEIVKNHCRPYDIVCRLGGDEFIIFMKDIPLQVVHKNIQKLLHKLRLTYTKNGVSVEIGASIGIAFADDTCRDFQTLYEKADKALYEVKKNEKGSYRIAE